MTISRVSLVTDIAPQQHKRLLFRAVLAATVLATGSPGASETGDFLLFTGALTVDSSIEKPVTIVVGN